MKTPFDETKHGRFNKLEDGRIEFLFTRTLPHPIAQVWKAISDVSAYSLWFPGLEVDLVIGGEFRMWFSKDCQGPAHVEGVVEALEPPTRLQLGSLRFELNEVSSTSGSHCQLTFSDRLAFNDTMSEQAFALSVLGGWHHYVDSLCASLDGIYLANDRPELDYSNIQLPNWNMLRD